jgi:multidrug efflux pump subunit AcrB
MRLIQWCLKNSMLLNLLTVMVLLLGIKSVFEMNKEAFPTVDFDVVSILTAYPGASPRETELYVTNPLEDEVKKVSGIHRLESTSLENWSSLVVFLDPDGSASQKNKTINDIQRAIDLVQDLPDEVPNPPKVDSIDSGDLPVLEVALFGGKSFDFLHRVGERLQERLEDLDDVKDAKIRGWREREFWVEVDPSKLDRYNVSLATIQGVLKARNLNLPGGVLKSQDGDILVRTMGEVETAKQIESIVLRTNDAGIQIKIEDVAKVRATFEEQKKIYHSNSQPSINILINKKATGDIIDLVESVKEETNSFLKSSGYEKDVKAVYINDMSVFVRNRLGVLLNNGYIGILLVLVVLLLFLSKGIAVVAAMGMPVALLACLMVMGMQNVTINLISMFGLVIVLGMLVDDAIIVAENIWQYYEDGESAWDACVKGASEVFWPVTATIATTIAAFSPLMMVSGIFGKFIAILPQVVIIALLASLIEAMLVLPSHAYDMLKLGEARKGKRREKDKPSIKKGYKNSIVQKSIDAYAKLLGMTLKLRYLFLVGIVALLAGCLWWSQTQMKQILFPSEGVEAFFIRAELQQKSSLDETDRRMRFVEKEIAALGDNELKNYVSHIGEIRDDPQDPLAQVGAHVAQIQVFLTPEKDRVRTADQIIEDLRVKLEPVTKAQEFKKLYFSRIRTGPPVGKPVAIRIRGDNLEIMDRTSDEIQAKLASIPGVSDISDNYNVGKDELKVIIDEDKASRSLLTVRDIALHVRAAIEGQIATYVRTGGDRIAVRVRYKEDERKEIDDFIDSRIINAAGYKVALKDIATFERSDSVQAIVHYNYRRTISVTAAIDETQTSSNEVNDTIAPYLEELRKQFPLTQFERGGEYEDTDQSMESLLDAFLIALAMIFVILATQFRSLTQPFVVMAAIPFGAIGVIIAFAVHDLPLSFLGMVGFIGLSGVVVNDSIVLVDFINNARATGMNAFDATIHAGRRRFRAVWLTTLTTVFGLIPLVYGWGGKDMFLKPAATALGYGLVFGTVLVLLMVPSLYLIRVDIGNFFTKLLGSEDAEKSA